MMIFFDKDKAARFLEAIKSGSDIGKPEEKGWSFEDMITLAGVLFHATQSFGNRFHPAWGQVHGEQQEALEAGFSAELTTAIQVSAYLAGLVLRGEYNHPPKLIGETTMQDGVPKLTIHKPRNRRPDIGSA